MEMVQNVPKPGYVMSVFGHSSVDNGSAVNVMSLRMLRALGRGIGDLIEIEVSVLAFIGEISKTLGVLPIDITVGSKPSLSSFFVINSTTNYNALI